MLHIALNLLKNLLTFLGLYLTLILPFQTIFQIRGRQVKNEAFFMYFNKHIFK